MESKNFNEELKKLDAESRGDENTPGLDDTQRVKVLSPSQLVFKRFIRNKLATVGTAILAFMFIFCWIGPIFYPYNQTQKFYKTDILYNSDFAAAKHRQEYTSYKVGETGDVHYSVLNMVNYYIGEMKKTDRELLAVRDETSGRAYILKRESGFVYTINNAQIDRIAAMSPVINICNYDMVAQTITYTDGLKMDKGFEEAMIMAVADGTETFSYGGRTYDVTRGTGKKYSVSFKGGDSLTYIANKPGEDFDAAVSAALGKDSFVYNGVSYTINAGSATGSYYVDRVVLGDTVYIASPYVINLRDNTALTSDELLRKALTAVYSGEGFSYNGTDYFIREENGELNIYSADSEAFFGVFSTFSVSRANGSGTLPIEFKEDIRLAIEEMSAASLTQKTIFTSVEKQAADGSIELDENGNIVYEDTEVKITRKGEDYAITCDRIKYLIDRYARPFSPISNITHILGTDGDGFDILARMMYGGRISLMVGFIVVIIETILGVIMGGISGYFGGWIDTLIMRLVDIFYCIPTLPILIILGGFFDNMQLNQNIRLMWLMAVLGFLGWAGIARIVRGQILSLREQEFMLATEVGGLRISRRIFRHLVPNVMPQLIVTATAGLGSVILTESTLSFLGLGVKPPYATWGTMINSVSDYNSMVNYTYIWVPVGLLICLTVIAFNFVGDGLRDAFDPKMKR